MASTMLSLTMVGAVLLSSTLAAPISSAQCSSYIVNATDNAWQFNHYKFLDFRNQSSSYLASSDFTSQYVTQTWSNSKFSNLAENVAMTSDNIDGEEVNMLSLYARQTNSQATAAELDSANDDYYYASMRVGARVTGASGACAGLFFYHSDTQETDIEILTREQSTHTDAETEQEAGPTTSQLHFTNQPHLTATVDLTPENTTQTESVGNGNLAMQGSWENVNTYRIDWVPGMTYWWQNGIMSHTANKNMIENPSSFIMNMWSNGDPSWSGSMAPNTEARLDILWIEMVYNKYSDGQPQQLDSSAYTGSCAVGVGDGAALGQAEPATVTSSQTSSQTSTETATETSTETSSEPAIATPAETEAVEETADGVPGTYGKRTALRFFA